jgi:hypothetical protein
MPTLRPTEGRAAPARQRPPLRAPLRRGALLAAILAPPAAAAPLEGYVRDPDGRALAGVEVQAWDDQLRGVATLSDSGGAYRFDDLPPGRYRVRGVPPSGMNQVWRFAPDALEFCEGDVVPLEGEGAPAGRADLWLPAGARLGGRLVGPDGAPAAGLGVIASAPADETGSRERLTFTDGDGRFEVVGLDVGAGLPSWRVHAGGTGWPDQVLGGGYDEAAATTWRPPEAGSIDIGEHALLEGILVEGSVVGAAGPVRDGTVTVYAGGQITSTALDADGRFSAVGLPPGPVLPWVTAPGYALTYWPDVDRPTEFLEATDEGEVLDGVELRPPIESTLTVQIVDDLTGAPVAELGALLYNDTQTVGQGDSTDSAGELTIRRLHGGSYQLFLWGADLGFADDWLRGGDGQPLPIELLHETPDQRLEVRLPPAATLSGRVVDDAGVPVAGAAVVVLRADGSGEAVRSDEEGLFLIPGLGPGEHQAWVEHTGLCPGDGGHVSVYWGDTVNPDWQSTLTLDAGERLAGVEWVMPTDLDSDAMGDRWERAHGLDPEVDDSALDPDGDQYSNLDEYRMGTDPQEGTPSLACGCGGGEAASLLVVLPLGWGARRRRRR